MKQTLLFIFSFCIFFPNNAVAQFPSLDEPKELSDHKNDTLYCMAATLHGNIISAGKSGKDLWLVELEPNGITLFKKKPIKNAVARDVIATLDSGYLIIGATLEKGRRSFPLLLKTDSNGDTIWKKQLPGEGVLYAVTEAQDSHFYVTGHLNKQCLIAKFDPQGELVWQRDSVGTGRAIIWKSNGTVAVAGYDDKRALWYRLDAMNGKIRDSKSKPKAKAMDMVTWKGGFVLTGTVHDDDNRKEGFLWKINTGDAMKFNTFGGDYPYDDFATSIAKASDDLIYVAGKSYSYEPGTRRPKFWLASVDPETLEKEADTIFGGEKWNAVYDILYLPSRHLVTVGHGASGYGYEQNPLFFRFRLPPPLPNDPPNFEWSLPDPDINGTSLQVRTPSIKTEMKIHYSGLLRGSDLVIKWETDNGKHRQDENVDNLISSVNDPKNTHVLIAKIDLFKGRNRVWVEADINGKKYSSDTMTINYNVTLHILTIGVPIEPLKYTTRDAEGVAKAFEQQASDQYKIGNFKTLIKKDETKKTALQKSILDIRKSWNVESQDIVIVFISTHGIIEEGTQEILLTASDYDGDYQSVYSLDLKKDVLTKLEGICDQVLLLIDACHSGGGKGKNNERRGSDVSKAMEELLQGKNRICTIASCSKEEKSYEHEVWKNGAFTQAILEALGYEKTKHTDENNQLIADADENGVLTIKELFEYLEIRVPKLVEERKPGKSQHPFMHEDWKESDFPIFYYKN